MTTQYNIALVDDFDVVRNAIFFALANRFPDALITEFESGENLLESLRKGSEFDLILLDYKLDTNHHVLWGDEVTALALKINPQTKIVGLTASDSDEVERKFRIAGAIDFVSKYETYANLVRKLEKILGIE